MHPRHLHPPGALHDGKHEHRPGLDITFSAPKSDSLEALVHAAPKASARIIRAHDEAVTATLDFIERELLETRGWDPATPEADYMARTVLSRDALGRLMANVAAGITYPNFKNAARGDAYHGHLIRVWHDAVSRLQDRRSD